MRTPYFPNIFVCIMGMGAQIGAMTYITIAYLALFFAKAEYRVAVFNAGLLFLALCGVINGFVTARTLKFFGATEWIFSAMMSAIILPIWVLTTIGIADTIEMMQEDGK